MEDTCLLPHFYLPVPMAGLAEGWAGLAEGWAELASLRLAPCSANLFPVPCASVFHTLPDP